MPLYLYWGDEDYTIDKKANVLKSQVISDDLGSLSYKKLSKPSLQDIIDSIQNAPCMFGDSLVRIETSIFLRGDKVRSSNDQLLKKLIQIMENIPPNLHILFITKLEKGSKKKIDSVSKLVKTVKANGEIEEFHSFKPWEEDKIISWINKLAKEYEVSISKDASKHLITCVGVDLRKIENEIQKLKLLILPNKNITLKEAKTVSASYENVFDLADYYIKNEREKVSVELHRLLEKRHPLEIIGALQASVKKWLKIKCYSHLSPTELSREIGLHEFVIKKEKEKLQRKSESEIIEFRKKLHKAESDIKSGNMPPNLALEMALLS